jgi:hypothetical protein
MRNGSPEYMARRGNANPTGTNPPCALPLLGYTMHQL